MAKSKASPTAPKAVTLEAQKGEPAQAKTDLLVVTAWEKAEAFDGAALAADAASGGVLARVRDAGDFKGKFKEMVLAHPAEGPAKRILLVGLGEADKWDKDRVRRVAAVIARRARDLGVVRAHIAAFPTGTVDAPVFAEAFAEGALLGLYAFERYKGKKEEEDAKKPKLETLVLLDADAARVRALKEGIAVGTVIAEATNQCRDWAAYSGADAAPAEYGERVKALAREHGLQAQVMDKRQIEALQMGGLLAVNQGSVREPRFVVLEHKPANAKHTVVIVGKGICFDSGGISIKPSDKMEDMKMDKSGASAALAAVVAAARLKLPLHVVALAPFTDNLPSGSAYKPGDIVTSMSGKTIEIINTDAEGRVILADALHYADRYKPSACVELSTLTGGCIVAVGHLAIAGMGNSDSLMAQIRRAGDATRERVWPMPFFDEYGEMVKSKVADVKNSAGRVASSVTGGKFLENFIGDWPWLHLDIASTAWHEGPTPRLNDEYNPAYATGIGTRLLIEWLRTFEPPAYTPKEKKPDSGKPKASAKGGRAAPKRRVSSM